MGLTLGLIVGALGMASAQNIVAIQVPSGEGAPGAYFPWVANGSDLDGMGPFYGVVTVQNLSGEARDLFFFPGEGENDHAYGHPYIVANVQENASVTVSAGSLDLPSPGGSVRVHSFPVGTGYDSDEREILLDEAEVDQNNVLAPIAGTVKNVSPVPSSSGKTSAAHVTVDGYSGLSTEQVADDNNQHILPIVQTNTGWNTMIRVASFGAENDPNANVSFTITYYEAGGQGAAGGSSGTFTGQIRGGDVAHIDIMDDPAIDEGWVGSAYITANVPIGAVAERYKPETDMLLTNVSRPVDLGQEVQVAPLVFQNYNNWNSGISVANLENNPITVNIAYVTPGGSQVGADQVTIPARGMEFVYTPASQDLSVNEFVGAAVLSGTGRHHAAVDQVKYDGVGSDIGDAMSYVTDSLTASAQQMLALPLVQKGNPATGLGDTSGIQFFNADPQLNIEFGITFYDPTGNTVAPTLTTPITFNLSGHQGVTVYTHNYSEMPAGFQGSMIATVTDGFGELAAVSNNVNYAVQADGAVVFNLVTTVMEMPEPTMTPTPSGSPVSTPTVTPTPTATPEPTPTATPEPVACIDLNTATFDELREIIHIDEVRAQAIIDGRLWASVNDLVQISGIGPARLQDILDQGLACVID